MVSSCVRVTGALPERVVILALSLQLFIGPGYTKSFLRLAMVPFDVIDFMITP